jgi:predicted RNA binding protein YcfA (HicA-like mRNA interferase family)
MRNTHHWPEEIFTAISEAERLGWTWTVGKKSHIKLKHPQGGSVTVSATPRRTSHIYSKIMADIRREATKWQHQVKNS